MKEKQKTDLVLGIILTISGIIMILGGYYELLLAVEKIEEIGYAGKLYTFPGFTLIFLGGCNLLLTIKLIIINLTKKRPWWI